MAKQISLILPDELLETAEAFARCSGQEVAEVLADAIEVSLDPLGIQRRAAIALRGLSDAEVVAIADSVMDAPQDQRLSELLRRQREGLEDSAEKVERQRLADEYQQGLLRKSFGIVEAVRRGLKPVPQP